MDPAAHFKITAREGRLTILPNLRGNALTKPAISILDTYAVPYDLEL